MSALTAVTRSRNGWGAAQIAESGALVVPGGNFNGNSLQQQEAAGAAAAEALHRSSLAVLRQLPPEELLEQLHGSWRPITDGYVLPEPVSSIFAEGRENKVLLLTGWNENEGLTSGPIRTAGEFRKETEKKYGPEAERLLHYYPAANDSIASASQYNLSRDLTFGVQNYAWANLQSRQHGSKVFVYRFTRRVPATGTYVKYGAFHTGEVPYAYDNLRFVDRPWEETDRHLASLMSSYWANFVIGGDPNGKDLPEWPAYDGGTRMVMYLGNEVKAKPMDDTAALDFLIGVMERDK